MYLKKVIISNFKNIEATDLRFSSKINCIYGDNGEGKTNLLDAIYYLSMTKSFLAASDTYIYRYGADETILSGIYVKDDQTEERVGIQIKRERDGKQEKIVRKDGKNHERISDHIGSFPIVVVSPSDSALISDSGEERRKFMNMILSQTDPEYLRSVQTYNKLLIQRNSLLKTEDINITLVDTISGQMEGVAGYIYNARRELAGKLGEYIRKYYRELSGGREEITIDYRSDLQRGGLGRLLKESYERDRSLRYTSVGIQRDDLIFSMNDHPVKRCGSQGQQKSFFVSLKFAQYDLMKSMCRYQPILLLDDVFDKLDLKRVGNMIRMVANDDFGQIFITDSNKVRLHTLVKSITEDSSFFIVKDGKIDVE